MEETVKNDGRNEKGCFLKGHKAIVIKHNTGNKGGRPKTIKGQVKDALKIAEDAMPEIIKSMIARATGEEECPKNVQQAAAEYLIERIYGKVTLPVSVEGKDKPPKDMTDDELISVASNGSTGAVKPPSSTP